MQAQKAPQATNVPTNKKLYEEVEVQADRASCNAAELQLIAAKLKLIGGQLNDEVKDLTEKRDTTCANSNPVGFQCKGSTTAVVWGNAIKGGDAGTTDMTNAADISCGFNACALRRTDGTAASWGESGFGGDSGTTDMTNVADITCSGLACALRRTDGTAAAWGNPGYGGDFGTTIMTKVVSITCGYYACGAITCDK
jgi:hypothetical protein